MIWEKHICGAVPAEKRPEQARLISLRFRMDCLQAGIEIIIKE